MNYWTKKNEMKRKAVEHTKEMMETHKDEIKHSIEATRTYGPEMGLVNREEHPVEMIVEQADSVLAVLTHAKEGVKPAVANFASYKNPGGIIFHFQKSNVEGECSYDLFMRAKTSSYHFTAKAKNLKQFEELVFSNVEEHIENFEKVRKADSVITL